MISIDDSVPRPRRETLLRGTFVPPSRRRTRIYSVHELVLVSKGCYHDEYQDGPPGSVIWNMGDRRNSRTCWGQFRDRCGALVNSGWFQNMGTCRKHELPMMMDMTDNSVDVAF
jgi:hypothetical protein